VSFLQDAASELLYPVLPIFLTVTLGAPIVVVGVVEGFAEGVAAAMKLVAGRLSDGRRLRPMIGLGYGLAAVGKVVIAFAGVWPVVLLGRGVDRFGKGFRGAPRDVLLVEGIPERAVGRAFGLHRAMDTAGAVVGPLIGLGLYEAFHHRIRPLLVLAVVPALASVFLVLAVRDRAPRPIAAPAVQAVSPADLPHSVRRLVLMLTLFNVVNFPDALLLLRAKHLGFGVAGVIGAYIVYNLTSALLSYPAGALTDRIGPRAMYAAGLVCFAVAYVGLAVVRTPAPVWALFAVYGGFPACTDGVAKTWINRLAPQVVRGRAQGTYQAATGAAVLVAGLWAGLAWRSTGVVPLAVSGTVAVAVAGFVLIGRPGNEPSLGS